MKTSHEKTTQDIYTFYREVLERPNLTREEIERMRVRIQMIAEATLNYLSKLQK